MYKWSSLLLNKCKGLKTKNYSMINYKIFYKFNLNFLEKIN